MKKILSMAAVAVMAVLGLVSCNDSNDTPKYVDVLVTNGVYVVNRGNQSSSIDGSLTYFDYTADKTSQNVYRLKNNASLGGSVCGATTYGSRIYIVGGDEQMIFVADKSTAAKIANIPTTGMKPRSVAGYGGMVYVSTYDNKVLAIDTLSNTITKTYECGNYSEGIDAIGKYVVTADSDYGKCEGNASISVIDTTTGKTTTYKNDLIMNPSKIMTFVDAYGSLHIYYLDYGKFDASYNQTGNGVYEIDNTGKSHKICDATMAAVGPNGYMYVINAPYSSKKTAPQYKVVSLGSTSNISQTFIDGKDIDAPAAIEVDPANGLIIITSYLKDADGKTQYSAPGKAIIYNAAGSKVKEFATGVDPVTICFSYGIKTIEL